MISTPVKDSVAFLRLRDEKKNELLEDTRLTAAADLAAQKELLLKDPSVPPGLKVEQVKQLSHELNQWRKKIRRPLGPGTSTSSTTDGEPEDDGLSAGPVHAWLTQMVNKSTGIKSTPMRSTHSVKQKASKSTPSRSRIPTRKRRISFADELDDDTEGSPSELPFQGETGVSPWLTPKERLKERAKKAARGVRTKAAREAKQQAKKAIKKGWYSFQPR